MRIREHFVGISKDRIQSFINRNREHCSKYPMFSNEENKPAIAKQPMERCQINLVVFKRTPSKDENGNIYKYILSCLDVFSRFIFLRRLKSKDTTEGANQLKEIFMTFRSPKMWQGFGIPPVYYPLFIATSTNKTIIMYLYFQVVLCLFHTEVKTKQFLKNSMSTHCVLKLIPSSIPKWLLIRLSLFYYPLSSFL